MITPGLFLMAMSASSAILMTVANLGGGGLRSASVGLSGLTGAFLGGRMLGGRVRPGCCSWPWACLKLWNERHSRSATGAAWPCSAPRRSSCDLGPRCG